VRIPNAWVLPILLIIGVLAAFLVTEPWKTLAAVGTLYLLLIPVSVRSFRRLKEQAERMSQVEVEPPTEGDEGAA